MLVCTNDGASATPGIRTDGPNFTGEETRPHRGPGWPCCPIAHVVSLQVGGNWEGGKEAREASWVGQGGSQEERPGEEGTGEL